MTRGIVEAILTASLLLSVATDRAGAARPAAPDAEEILRRAEEVRNPALTYAADFTIHSVSGRDRPYEWNASYSMIAKGKDGTLILMRTPPNFFGGLVLMAEGRYWMLLPRATKPMELSESQVIRGDISSGDLARADLSRGYTVEGGEEDLLDGEPCWRLDLKKSATAARYSRIVYWVAKKGFLPRRLDHYGHTGALLKTVHFSDYRKGSLGLRPSKLVIESHGDWRETSTLSFSGLRKTRADDVPFAPERMQAFRDAALALREAGEESDVAVERIVQQLAAR